MKAPKHIQHLASCGRTYADLTAFRAQLESFRITLCWNTNKREWIFCKIMRPGEAGPTTLLLRVGTEALAALMASSIDVARQFEEMAQRTDGWQPRSV